MKTNSLLLLVAAAAGAAGLVWYFKTSSAADAATAAPATGLVDVAGAPAGAATATGGGGLFDAIKGLLFGNTATDNTAPTTLTSSLASGLTSGTQTTTPGAAVSPPPGPPAYDLYTVKQLPHGTLVTYFAFDSKGTKRTIGTAFRPAPQGETKAQLAVRLKITAPPAGTTHRPPAPAAPVTNTAVTNTAVTTGTALSSNQAIRAAVQAGATIGTYYESPLPPAPPVSTIGQPSNVRIKHTRPGGAA